MEKDTREFAKLVNRLKSKHGWNQRDVAYQCYTTESVISECLHGKRGYNGHKFVKRLQWFVDQLEPKKQEKSEELVYCKDCHNYHVGGKCLQAW